MEQRKQQLQQKSMKVTEIHTHALNHMKTKFRYISASRQVVIAYIVKKMKKYNGTFFESHTTIATALKLSVSTVRRAIENAKRLGMFATEKCFERTVNGKMRQTTNNIILLPFTSKKISIGEVVAVPTDVKESVEGNVQPEHTYNGQATETKQQQDNTENDALYELYKEYKIQGISKQVFDKLITEIKESNNYKNFIPYVRGSLERIVTHKRTREMSWDEMMIETCNRLGL